MSTFRVEWSMSNEEENEILSGAVHGICRAQWAALNPDGNWGLRGTAGTPATTLMEVESQATNSVVDPEALVLTSLSLGDLVPDLMECVNWWASAGASFTNWGRLKRMAALYGPRGWESAETFASIRKKKTPTLVGMEDVEWEWPALMVRVRGLFGVSARADNVTFLLASDWTHATVSEISGQLLYSKSSTRGALEAMRRAGGIFGSDTSPTYYSLNRGAWSEALGLPADVLVRRCLWPDWMRIGALCAWRRETGHVPDWSLDPAVRPGLLDRFYRLDQLEEWMYRQL